METDVTSGRRTRIAETARKALRALEAAKVPYAVVGATALGVRGLPRFSADLDVIVTIDDAFSALGALAAAGFKATPPVDREAEPEPMYVLSIGTGVDVDVLVAAGEPECTIISDAPRATVFGKSAPVATLEHLLLMYLYSNQLKHAADFARIVTEANPDLAGVERYLAEVHPEMLPVLRDRVASAKSPPAAPPRPPKRRR
jgi:hypothetical protein